MCKIKGLGHNMCAMKTHFKMNKNNVHFSFKQKIKDKFVSSNNFNFKNINFNSMHISNSSFSNIMQASFNSFNFNNIVNNLNVNNIANAGFNAISSFSFGANFLNNSFNSLISNMSGFYQSTMNFASNFSMIYSNLVSNFNSSWGYFHVDYSYSMMACAIRDGGIWPKLWGK